MTAASAVCYPLPDLGATIYRYAARTIPCLLVGFAVVYLILPPDLTHAKRKPVHVEPPDLRIVAVTIAPDPYSPGAGSLDFTVEVELPHDLNDATMLEVSSLISSPSKSSLRFLASRQPLAMPPSADSAAQVQPSAGGPVISTGESAPRGSGADGHEDGVRGPEGDGKTSRIAVKLTWDGRDHTKQLVINGKYGYEVRAKLLVLGENGLRTLMVSWPKRGTLEVK